MFIKSLVGSFAILAMLVGSCHAQDMNYGRLSEADRFMHNFRRQASASAVKENVIRGATTVSNGFGTRTTTSPTFSNLTQGGANALPRRQPATFGVGNAGTVTKPFAAITPRPTVSPYLGLFNEGIGDNDLNYQTLVRPQLQQQQFNDQVVRQAQAINQRLTSIAARNAYNARGAETMMPTGHAATFQYYSRFYPQMSRRR